MGDLPHYLAGKLSRPRTQNGRPVGGGGRVVFVSSAGYLWPWILSYSSIEIECSFSTRSRLKGPEL